MHPAIASPMTPAQLAEYDAIVAAAIRNLGTYEAEAFINGAKQAAWVAVSRDASEVERLRAAAQAVIEAQDTYVRNAHAGRGYIGPLWTATQALREALTPSAGGDSK